MTVFLRPLMLPRRVAVGRKEEEKEERGRRPNFFAPSSISGIRHSKKKMFQGMEYFFKKNLFSNLIQFHTGAVARPALEFASIYWRSRSEARACSSILEIFKWGTTDIIAAAAFTPLALEQLSPNPPCSGKFMRTLASGVLVTEKDRCKLETNAWPILATRNLSQECTPST